MNREDLVKSDFSWGRAQGSKCDFCKEYYSLFDYDIKPDYVGRHYTYTTKGYSICRTCYHYVRNPSECRYCNTSFDSRNKLFIHLKETCHYM